MSTRTHLLRPDLWVGSVTEITAAELHARGIRGLILDLDETLVSAFEHTPPPAIHAWVQEMKASFSLYILSNNPSARRVQVVADQLEIPCACRASKPRRKGFRSALADMGIRADQAAIIGDQLFTDVLGGNRLGAMTILATPIAPETKPLRKLMRLVEGMFIREADSLRDKLHPDHLKETP